MTLSLICIHCNKSFEPKRKSARYCSTSCRVSFSRSKGSTDTNITDIVEETIAKVEKRVSGHEIKPIERFPDYRGSNPFGLCNKHNVFFASCRCE